MEEQAVKILLRACSQYIGKNVDSLDEFKDRLILEDTVVTNDAVATIVVNVTVMSPSHYRLHNIGYSIVRLLDIQSEVNVKTLLKFC